MSYYNNFVLPSFEISLRLAMKPKIEKKEKDQQNSSQSNKIRERIKLERV
jgi:hypothetical protein